MNCTSQVWCVTKMDCSTNIIECTLTQIEIDTKTHRKPVHDIGKSSGNWSSKLEKPKAQHRTSGNDRFRHYSKKAVRRLFTYAVRTPQRITQL